MIGYEGVLVKRLREDAMQINAYEQDGLILGYASDASGALLDWPTMAEFEAEWALLEAELSAAQFEPTPEPSVAELQAQIALLQAQIANSQAQTAELQRAMLDMLLTGGF